MEKTQKVTSQTVKNTTSATKKVPVTPTVTKVVNDVNAKVLTPTTDTILPTVSTQLKTTTTELVAEIKEVSNNVLEIASKSGNEVVSAIKMTETLDKVKDSAQNVNAKIKETAIEVVSDLKEIGVELKEVANKNLKEMATSIDFSDSVSNVKNLVNTINTELKSKSTELMNEVSEKANSFKVSTNNLAKEAIENIKLSDRLSNAKESIQNGNKVAMSKTEALIDTLETNGQKWQNIANKAIKTGLDLSDKQQDMFFTTLEAVKTQIETGVVRFKKLLANN